MTLLRKDSPGGAPGGYEWVDAGDVIDVPRDLAADLLAIPDGDFTEVDGESDLVKTQITEPDPDALPTKKADLVALATSLGVDATGTVKEIAARIVEHRSPEPAPSGEQVPLPPVVEDSTTAEPGDATAPSA